MSTRDFFNRDRLKVSIRQAIVLVAIPYALSLLMDRRGWQGDAPGFWNWCSVTFIVAGFSIFAACLGVKLARAKSRDGPIQNDLLVSGPYKFSRNPMFVAVLLVWFGWALFYGSIPVSLGFVAIWGYMALVWAPSEERHLEERFGDAYRSYKNKVPRWIGRGAS